MRTATNAVYMHIVIMKEVESSNNLYICLFAAKVLDPSLACLL